jgi:DNA-binding CsgD family transcriptional regulator
MENMPSYLGLAAVAGVMIWASNRLFLKYPQRMLLFFANALAFGYAFGVVDIIGRFLALEVFGRLSPPPAVPAAVSFVFRLLAWPCLVLSWYFFIRMILEIRARSFPVAAQAAFFIVQAAALVAYFLAAENTQFKSPVSGLPLYDLIMLIFSVANRGAVFVLLVWATVAPAADADPERRRGLNVFTGLYAAAYLLYGIAALFMKSRGFLCYTYPVLEFFMHVPPLVYLWIFMRSYCGRHSLQPAREGVLVHLFARHQISSREQEVVRLLLEGKSGRDMARELFVSVKTVKTHVSSVYRKLGIKSRWQLITLIQNSQDRYREF